MPSRTLRSRTLAHNFLTTSAVLAATLVTSAPTAAQLPEGHLVLSSYKHAGNRPVPGVGGLYFVDPTSNAVTAVTGLPCEIRGTCPNSVSIDGADFVIRLPDTGQLVVGGWGATGQPIWMFALFLNGTTVTHATQYRLATVGSFAGSASPAAALLPDGRVLLAMDPTNSIAPGALAGARLGIFDPTRAPSDPNALTVLPAAQNVTGVTNALAVDPVRNVAYLAVNTSYNSAAGSVFEVQLATGGPARLVASIPFGINAMILEPDGQLLVGGGDNRTGRLVRLDPVTGSLQSFPQTFSTRRIQALRVDPVSGDLHFATGDADLKRLSPRSTTGTVQLLSSGGAAGWGVPSGLDMADTLRTYGSVSGTGAAPRFLLAPNAGGAPTVGNARFSLRCSGGTPAFWALGASPLGLLVGGSLQLELLVSPDVLLAVTLQPAPIGNQLDLPIPADPGLHGARLYAQTFVPAGMGVAASQGLEITLR